MSAGVIDPASAKADLTIGSLNNQDRRLYLRGTHPPGIVQFLSLTRALFQFLGCTSVIFRFRGAYTQLAKRVGSFELFTPLAA